MKFIHSIRYIFLVALSLVSFLARAQINTDQVVAIGRNAMYFEDYILSIQYFNQAIAAKPYLAEPYFYRSVAKLQLEDYSGAEADASLAIERNPFIVDAYQVRGIARQNLKDLEGAVADYDKGLEQLPESQPFLLNKAVALTELKRFDDASTTFEHLFRFYPNFDRGYIARAQMNIEHGDTVAALADADKSISLSKTNADAFALRAAIKMQYNKEYEAALADFDSAIKLEPQYAPYFINRAFAKYSLDDYFGAMADYDYAVSLDPTNVVARFNRGLLLAQVRDNNKAISDFSFVIEMEPKNVMARYNRAELYAATRQYALAVADYDVVIDASPEMAGLYYARSECKRLSGDIAGGERDYNKSQALYRARKKRGAKGTGTPAADSANAADENPAGEGAPDDEEVKAMFQTLLTVEPETNEKPRYDNKTRGRIQDSNFRIDAAPMFFISYYYSLSDLNNVSNFAREITDLNEMKVLAAPLYLTNVSQSLSEEEISRHFNSINYYTGLISNNPGRSIDYFARAIDFFLVKNYDAALADLNRAIALSPDFTLAYFARANVRMSIHLASQARPAASSPQTGAALPDAGAMIAEKRALNDIREVIADLDEVISRSPQFIYAYYNKGCALYMMRDYTSSISAFSKAVELKRDLGEAYYNRGLSYFSLGNKALGTADLSKAGELGISPSYSVLKRMTR